jgi:hypothetical protein
MQLNRAEFYYLYVVHFMCKLKKQDEAAVQENNCTFIDASISGRFTG